MCSADEDDTSVDRQGRVSTEKLSNKLWVKTTENFEICNILAESKDQINLYSTVSSSKQLSVIGNNIQSILGSPLSSESHLFCLYCTRYNLSSC
jgi:hypothetical protein